MKRSIKTIVATGGVITVGAAGVIAPALAATKSVTVSDNKFSSKSLTVSKGTTVKWTWKGKAPHNVTASGAASFSSKTQSKGTFSKKLSKKGTYKVVCTIHPGMAMSIKVK